MFLFLIVGEAFSQMLAAAAAAVAGRLIQGFTPALDFPVISHLQFIDDTIIFCDANEEQVKMSRPFYCVSKPYRV